MANKEWNIVFPRTVMSSHTTWIWNHKRLQISYTVSSPCYILEPKLDSFAVLEGCSCFTFPTAVLFLEPFSGPQHGSVTIFIHLIVTEPESLGLHLFPQWLNIYGLDFFVSSNFARHRQHLSRVMEPLGTWSEMQLVSHIWICGETSKLIYNTR